MRFSHGIVIALAVGSLCTARVWAAEGASNTVSLPARPFELKQVHLLDGPFKHAMDLDAAYLLKLEPDRLLAGFREDAGFKPKARRYGAWESQGVAGHTLGHYLSACSLMYAATGDERFRERVAYIVEELASCQKANGDGYVAGIPEGKRIFAEIRRGEIRSQGFDLNGGWVPWYTLHKQLAGLRDAYLYARCTPAREVARGLADWAITLTNHLNDEQMQTMLACEQGGMSEVAADLSAMTGEEKYLQLARRFNHQAVLAPLMRREDRLAGLHANTQFPKLIGAARQYELTGDPSLQTAATFFWQTVTRNHTYVTGSNSDGEHFGPPGKLAQRLSNSTAETCNVYNMLKLTQHLFSWHPSAELADYYERALFNHILASQDPESGRVIYYLPLRQNATRKLQDPFDAFTCCVGTGMENHARYGEAIYAFNDTSLYVNQFIASVLTWEDKHFTLRQETRFPMEAASRLVVKCDRPVELTIQVRRPSWAKRGFSVAVNEKSTTNTGDAGSFVAIHRTWKEGDVIQVSMPMELRTESMPDDGNRLAILYGPLVLAGELGDGSGQAPVLVSGARPANEWVQPTGQPLTFKTVGVGQPRDVQLAPLYRVHGQHYLVYWDRFTEQGWEQRQALVRAEQERIKALEARTLDFVQPGEMQPERDHAFDGEKSRTGEHLGRKWRDAAEGGRFAFTMKLDAAAPVQLICTYWGSDAGGRTFDILLDGEKVATQTLNHDRPDSFFDVIYDLPEKLTSGKDKMRITFQAQPGNMAGGVFGCRVVKKAP